MLLVRLLLDLPDSARRTFKASWCWTSFLLCVAKITPLANAHPRMTCLGVTLYFTARSSITGFSQTIIPSKNHYQPIFATATGTYR